MEYRFVKLGAELLYLTAPSYLEKLRQDRSFETLCVAGFEGGKAVCLSFFSRLKGSADCYLEYIYCTPPCRGKGFAEALFGHCISVLKELGFRRLLVKKAVNPEEAERLHQMLMRHGFLPLNCSQRLMLYSLEDIRMAGLIPLILGNQDKLPQILSFKEAGEGCFRRFMEKIGRRDVTGMGIFVPYSQFFLEGDEISGAMLAWAAVPSLLAISLISLDETAKKQGVFPELLAKTLDAAEKSLGEGFSFLANVEEKTVYDGLLQVFNPPDDEGFFLEYAMDLGNPENESRLVPEDECAALTAEDVEGLPSQREKRGMDALRDHPGVAVVLSSREFHMLSPRACRFLSSGEDAGMHTEKCAERLRSNLEDYRAQKKKKDMAKNVKRYLLHFQELRKELEADPSMTREKELEKLKEYGREIEEDIRAYRELYVSGLVKTHRRRGIKEQLKRYDLLMAGDMRFFDDPPG